MNCIARYWIPGTLAVLLCITVHAAPTPERVKQRAEQLLAKLSEGSQADFSSFIEDQVSARLREKYGEDRLSELMAEMAMDLGPGKHPLLGVRPADDGFRLSTRTADGDKVGILLWLESGPDHRIDGFGLAPGPEAPRGVDPKKVPDLIRSFVDQRAEAGQFSGALLVAVDGEPLFADAWGQADRESGRANTLATPINLGSMNKMFTGLAIAQLQAKGKLDWNDTVGKYLPDYPNETVREQVTIHQLLTHTSGIPSYWNEAYDAAKDQIDSLDELAATFAEEPLLFEPGQGNEYSNGGPVVLGLIIEAITGMSYYDYVRKNIYTPARMENSDSYRRDDPSPGFAKGYGRPRPDGPWIENSAFLGLMGSPAGGGYASARDLLRFSRALQAERLLDRKGLETLWNPPRKGPEEQGYGYLWGRGELNGHRWVGHNGGAPGVSADFRYYPEQDATVVVLANQSRAAMPVSEWLNDLISANLFD